MSLMKYETNNLEETQKIADNFARNLNLNPQATVVGLYGELGAGKTSFVQGVAKSLGILGNIVSPTFVIEKIYEIVGEQNKFKKLIHIDAYRLEHSDELLHIGWREIISDPQNLVLIEWPEKVADIMPKHIRINLKHVTPDSREIDIEKVI